MLETVDNTTKKPNTNILVMKNVATTSGLTGVVKKESFFFFTIQHR